MINRIYIVILVLISLIYSSNASSGLTKSVIQVDSGNTKLTGSEFIYRLTYSCDNVDDDCLNAQVIDDLPPSVEYLSHVVTSDVDNVTVVGNLITFNMVSPLDAGRSGDLLINVRFPNGVTPDGTVASNTADGVNLNAAPGTTTTPPVDVTAVASANFTIEKTLLGPASLDVPSVYQLRISNPNEPGRLNIENINLNDTLPAGVTFLSASPAADCEPVCQNSIAPALNWSGPLSANVGQDLVIIVNVLFPTPTFSDGDNATNTFTGGGTPVGEGPIGLGVGEITHPINTFVADPDIFLNKNVLRPNPPTLNQEFSYHMRLENRGNTILENVTVIDDLPIQFQLTQVGSGLISNHSGTVSIDYNTNLNPLFTNMGSNPVGTYTYHTAPILGVGEYFTQVRWTYSDPFPPSAMTEENGDRLQVLGQIINPANDSTAVAIGDTVTNCSGVTSVFDPLGVNQNVNDNGVNNNNCANIVISEPFVQLNPTKTEFSSGPYLPGNTVDWRLFVNNYELSSDPIPLEDLVVTDLLPIDLIYDVGSFVFNPFGSGLPAPNFTVVENFNNTGRTLLSWTWPSGSGLLAIDQTVRIDISTIVRDGASFGDLENTLSMTHNNPGLEIRCNTNSTGDQNANLDSFDMDQDGSTNDIMCENNGTAEISVVAQLASSKEVMGICDADFTDNSLGALLGTPFKYQLTVQNQGTLNTEEFVFIDILPFVGDTGVLDTNARASLWEPVLLAPITPPSGTILYYSTSGNPCRPEVGGITTGCDAPNWGTSPPIPISDVKSFKIEFEEKNVLPFDTLQFELSMFAPADSPTNGDEAFNSFAYLGERADGVGPLSAEPNKVGISIGNCPILASLGDYVWVDSNINGLQDDGNTGLNGVYAQLFNDGPDGLSNTADDELLSTTITSDDIDGNPGWYHFVTLPEDNYYVCFAPPVNYNITDQYEGGDDSLDSDVNPDTRCTDPVFLPAGTDNPDLDLGLVGPFAALGNYVWWDLNTDGVQNEPVDYGVNGVTVNLFADNGDGTPDPNTDLLLATQVTADDLFGSPGYYSFGELVAGVPYFIQFIQPSPSIGFTTQNIGDDSQDSDAATSNGVTEIVILSIGEYNPTIDAGMFLNDGELSLGNQVWFEPNAGSNGLYEPQTGETGIDGVNMDLYLDFNSNNLPDANEYVSTTQTSTSNGFTGRYNFTNLSAGNYLVVVDSGNFTGVGTLGGLTTCTANDPATDPDDDINGDDDGIQAGGLVVSLPITLSANGEPITDGDSDNNSNLTDDFCFTPQDSASVVFYDYGDAIDTASGSGNENYQTTSLDLGAVQTIDPGSSPILGQCVDAESGQNQNQNANADDTNTSTLTAGTCLVPGDDEDGVTFSSLTVLPNDTLDITLTAAAGLPNCFVNGWIDWNQNGVFEDSDIVADMVEVVAGGSQPVSIIVPASVTPGALYARFRCNSFDDNQPASVQTGVGPNLLITGSAPFGEVEDYVLQALGEDWGDALDSYDTEAIDDGPRHTVNPFEPMYLGSCVDTESDGAPSGNATGDDTVAEGVTVGFCFDDEDGVVFNADPNNILMSCTMNQAEVVANKAGNLDAWVDFNGNGVFDPAEQIANSQALTFGTNNLSFMVPCNAAAGNTQTRFRFSTAGGLNFTGPADDGEVEDHAVVIRGIDLGDAPSNYPVTLVDNGAYHAVDPTNPLYLGSCVDTESNGQSSVNSNGDDTNVGAVTSGTCVSNDDEDGVVFDDPIVTCLATDITVTANAAGVLDAWFDFNNNGSWAEANEKIFSAQALAAGSNSLQFTTPCNATTGLGNLRFRYSTDGSANPTGSAIDGEIEDHQVNVMALDFGDLPDPSYPTSLANNGARHMISTNSTVYLGSCVDSEINGQPNSTANGDDLAIGNSVAGTCSGNDDEDGISFDNGMTVCENTNLTVTANTAGLLNAFVDFNSDGSFGAGEQVFTNQALTAGDNSLSFNVPCTASSGNIYSRFRISTAGSDAATGLALDGEVEDYVHSTGSSADLRINKTDNADPISAGANLTYTITVNNDGPNDATNVVVTDTLPSNVTLISTSGCVQDPNGIPSCSLGNIAASSSAQYTVTVQVDDDLANGTTITNNASVSSDQNDPDTSDNTTSEETLVERVSDLSVTKTDSADPVTAGSPLSYTINVQNLGPSLAENVVATDNLPAGVTLVSTSGCTEDPVAIPTCSLGDLQAGTSVQYTVNVTVNAGFDGTLNNTVSVDSDSDDNTAGNNSDTEPTIVGAAADLSITKVDNIDPAPAGTALTYTLSVFNAGPSDAVNVVINDVLPTQVTLVSTSGCNEDPNGIPNCSLGNVLVGQTVNVQIAVTVNNDAVGNILNTASVSSDTPDQDTTNNSDDETTTVESADLSISKVDDVDPIRAGENLTYTIRVDNAGPSDAENVVVNDILPTEVTLVSTNGCQEDPNAIPNCSLGTISAGSFATYQVVVSVDSDLVNGTSINNIASVSSSTTDTNPDNDTTNETTEVITEADLNIVKTLLLVNGLPFNSNNSEISPGDTIRYEITVNNLGPSLARNVVVTDNLPTELDFVASTGCAEDPNGVPNCSLGNLNVNSSVSYFIDVTVNNNHNGVITNTADVSSDTTDQDTNNNTDVETTNVESADLSISKLDDVDPVIAGDNLTYTIRVDNAGPSDAEDVVVTDTLPIEVTLVSTSGCQEDSNGVPICTLGTINAGSFATYQVVVRVDPSLSEGTSILNSASVTSSTTDINPDNDSTEETTDVVTEADINIEKSILLINGAPFSNDNTVISPGDAIRYEITVNNIGPSIARNIIATDNLPNELDFIASLGCTEDPNGVPNCSLGDLDVNSSVSYFIDVIVNNSVDGMISNTAEVSSDTLDPVSGNNTETSVIGGRIRLVPINNYWYLLSLILLIMFISSRKYKRFRIDSN